MTKDNKSGCDCCAKAKTNLQWLMPMRARHNVMVIFMDIHGKAFHVLTGNEVVLDDMDRKWQLLTPANSHLKQ